MARDLPRLYAILDADAVRIAGAEIFAAAAELRDAGIQLLQYRDKQATREARLRNALEIGKIFAPAETLLLLNDDPELAAAADWHGVHVGQGDLSAERARAIVGSDRLVGVSTHTLKQMKAATATDADYIAVGPVFPTATKADAEDAIGIDGVRALRRGCDRPMVAIGGIDQRSIAEVFEAGADSVAVIGALFASGQTLNTNAHQLLRIAADRSAAR